MNKMSRRLLSLACGAALLLGMLPGVSAAAPETVTTTDEVRFVEELAPGVYGYQDKEVTTTRSIPQIEEPFSPISTFAITQEGNYDYTFTTFADLKELAAGSYTDYVQASYAGSDPLVIAEDLALPEYLSLDGFSAEIIVPAGVTFSASNSDIYAGTLTVNGTVIADYVSAGSVVINGTASARSLRASTDLTISGTLHCSSQINLDPGAVLTGKENISFASSWASLVYEVEVTDMATLKEAVAAANASADSHVEYVLYFFSELTINESVAIPESCRINAYEALTIASGCTLTVASRCRLCCPMTVEGTLCNNGTVVVEYDRSGVLTIASGGAYTGNGILEVFGDELTAPGAAVPGLDLSNFEAAEYNDYAHYWELRDVTGLTQLAAPTNPEWGYQHEWDGEITPMPGAISWQPHEPTQSRAMIRVYREGETEPCSSASWRFGSDELPEWRSVESFCMDNPESGTYYFTVTSRGDYINYYNSETVTSDTWTYVKPDAQVDTCSGLSWNWPYVSYSGPADTANVGGYEVEFYFSATESGNPDVFAGTWSFYLDDPFFPDVSDSEIQEYGLGYYYFKVRALSADITVACNGEWSELSPAFNLTELSSAVESELEDVIADKNQLTDDQIRDAVQSMDTEELKSAMLADQSGTGALADIAELEDAVGGSADIIVTPEAQAFDASQVSIVGANLNNAASETDPITLVIDKPEEDHVLDALYDSSVAVKFSMDLDNVEDSENLDVPVMITLPVPANINPEFLVILHYHANGTREELMPPRVYVRQENGQWLASFALTSFSDFVMTQFAPECSHTGGTATCLERAVCALCGESYGELNTTNHVGETEWNMTSYSHSQTYTCCQAEAMPEASHSWSGTVCTVCGHEMVIQEGLETTPMYRLYNPNSGEHFYTGSIEERDNLVAAGWIYEGVAWNAPTKTGQNVYRLYNPNSGDHHYTMSAEERDMLVDAGWIYEGVCWNSATPDTLPLFRLYNPNANCGSHHYTGSIEERNMLVEAGWHYEGIGWFGTLR